MFDAPDNWELDEQDFWFRITPPNHDFIAQGWKIHVSATPLSAALTLARAGSILVRSKVAFKFAKNIDAIESLLSRGAARGSSGKFITAYPRNDSEFREIIARVDEVTQDLRGPRILSDRAVRDGSVVHYRYGVFGAEPVFTVDGTYESMLTAPDGSFVNDARNPWFSPPAWAAIPIDECVQTDASKQSKSPWIGQRFSVRAAIRHSGRGSVYRAYDEQSSTDVIIKQPRHHMEARLNGTDARDVLRREAGYLETFAPLRISPRRIALFEQQEDVFLAEELIPGKTLRATVEEGVESSKREYLTTEWVLPIARRLAELVSSAHTTGLVLRDFTPGNIIVTPDRSLRLIDLEHVAMPGSLVYRCYTLGYAAPEQTEAPPFGHAPDQRADLYSLGATIFYAATGADPLVPSQSHMPDGLDVVLRQLVDAMQSDHEALARLSPAILGLMREDPEERWSVERLLGFLRSPAGLSDEQLPAQQPGRLSPPALDCLIDDGLAYLSSSMTPDKRWLWKPSQFGSTTDPVNVQHGAAGVLEVLTRAASHGLGDGLDAAVQTGARWIAERLDRVPRFLPGLYFGRSGTAWSLHSAALHLGDQALAKRALEFAQTLPVKWDSRDMTHGLAGAGTAMLHLWEASGDPRLRDRAVACAESILASSVRRSGQIFWPVSACSESSMAGLTHFGFAHGVAGTGSFLLAAGVATGQAPYLEAAVAAGETLHRAAEIGAGGAVWPTDESGEIAFQHWCSGASGVGTFLIRLWRATGDQIYAELAADAAATVRHRIWRAGNSVCHGISGDGEFLLDMHHFTGETLFRSWAEDVADVLKTRRIHQGGRMLIGGERATEVSADYNTGLSGVLGFLIRLQHGGKRWWMADSCLESLPFGGIGEGK
ncbi:hypothetical protein ADK75_06170 [Streptomyces virginiae]|uniref:non-specific serine/threonine protein kinase n=2 Tax=Streptomyces virginiae TaxID=1961 RepID=A0A0L8N2T5_STRVG|nr:hypothetical protein ADK75_06170 [Streptomyces virginiae]